VLSEDTREQLCQNCGQVVSSDFIICPFCQHVLKEKCASCGNPVESNWEVCPSCGTEIEREWKAKHCPHCLGLITTPGDACPFCGGTL
jgi:RNA polymerase subunit RPABC4/transcription elongation factor Spt4